MSTQTLQYGKQSFLDYLDGELAARPARVIRTIDADQLMGRIARCRQDWILAGHNLTAQTVTVQQMYKEFADILTDMGLADADLQITGQSQGWMNPTVEDANA